MKIDLETQLEKLDEYFQGKNKRIYFMGIFVAILYFSYVAIEPLTADVRDYFNTSLQNTRTQIQKMSDPDEIRKAIQRQGKSLDANNNKIAQLEEQKKLYVDNVNSFAKNFFHPDGLNAHINQVANKALQRNIEVTNIKNLTTEMQARVLAPMYDVNVSFNAKRFDSVIGYLYDLESTSEISDISSLDISSQNNGLKGFVNIITWGFKNE